MVKPSNLISLVILYWCVMNIMMADVCRSTPNKVQLASNQLIARSVRRLTDT